MTGITSLGQTQLSDIPILENDRLRLRPHAISDLDQLAEMWTNPDYVRYIGNLTRSKAEVWKAIQSTIGSWALLGYGYWVIETREHGEFVGETGFLESVRPVEPDHVGTPEAGWGIVPNQWGKGYASEALATIVKWADGVFPDKRTVCMIETSHEASVRVAEKNGFVFAYQTMLGDDAVQIFERNGL
ncbi:MAG: GNAT family N-acetyltransferase [Pseudomonadota bacterium]